MRAGRFVFLCLITGLFSLSACSGKVEKDTPKTTKDERREARGRLSGDDGLIVLGGSESAAEKGSPLGVNSFLWRATLDTLSFMPLASADPFGGVIITDWYENPKAPGDRFKVNALILDRTLRSDGVRVSFFKQSKDKSGVWRDQKADPAIARDLEDTILTRARQLKVQSSGKQ